MSATPSQPPAIPGAVAHNTPPANIDRKAAPGLDSIPRTRQILIACVAACVMIGLTWLIRTPRPTDFRPVLNGRSLSSLERLRAQRQLRSAGLTEFRQDGDRLLAPAERLPEYDAALQTLTADTPQIDGTNSFLDSFRTSRQQEAAREAAQAAHLSRLLAQLPGVESAEIVWDEEPRIGWRRPPRVRATVFLKPRSGCALGLDTVHAVRTAVAGSRAHLDPGDVTIMDLERMVTYGTPSSDDTDEEGRRALAAAACRNRIEQALSHINGVHVAVMVEPAPENAPVNLPPETAPSVDTRTSTPEHHPRRTAMLGGPNMRLELPNPLKDLQPGTGTDPVVATPKATSPSQSKTPAPENREVFDVSVVIPAEYIRQKLEDALRRAAPSDPHSAPRNLPESIEQAIVADVEHRITTLLAETTPAARQHRLSVRAELVDPSALLVPPTAARSDRHSPWQALRGSARSWGWAGFLIAAVLTSLAVVRRVRDRAALPLRSTPPKQRRRSDGRTTGANIARSSSPDRNLDGHPRAYFGDVPSGYWAPRLAAEPLRDVAAVLPQLTSDEVGAVMALLSPEQQREVLELAAGQHPDETRADAVRERIRAQWQSSGANRFASEPDFSTRPAATTPLAHFDELAHVNDSSLQSLSRRVPPELWSAALLGASPKLRNRIARLRMEGNGVLQPSKPLRLRDIEEAQQRILEAWSGQASDA